MPLGAVRAAILGIKKGIQGILVGPAQITTSTVATATAYSNQRKIDRTSNGVLWMVYTVDPGNKYTIARYSTDDGATWTDAGQVDVPSTVGSAYTPNPSFFIDQDDYAHLVFKGSSNGYIYYRRGTPNAGRTAWTWSAATQVTSTTGADYPDVVVAKNPTTGWDVFITCSTAFSSPNNHAIYSRIYLDAAGAVVSQNRDGLTDSFFGPNGSVGILGGGYGINNHTYPSIDFNHTGGGKTVAGGTPHLYAAWSAGATGSGKGIRFKKATYSAGTWTWGTEREISPNYYVNSTSRWLNCLFDGTRVIMTGCLYEGANEDTMLFERDAADTNTITRELISNTNTAGNPDSAYLGSSTYDQSGNVYIFGRDQNSAVWYRKWNRSSNSLGTRTEIDPSNAGFAHISVKRGYSNNRIEFIYTDGTASPYSIKYGGIT